MAACLKNCLALGMDFMSKPVIIVLSRDEMMASELPGLFRGQAEILACRSLDEFNELARNQEPSALLADFRRSTGSGREEARMIETVQRQHPRIRLAMVTPVDCPANLEQCASKIEITHFRGHLDRAALLKAFSLLVPHPLSATEIEQVASESTFWWSEGAVIDATPLGHLTGTNRRYETWSADLSKSLNELKVAAMHDVAILLIGETGVGTSYLAHLIHEISPRRYEPFLTLSCGTRPMDLLERELFGHSEGSAAGGPSDPEGTLLTARRGTVLLEEIDAIGLEQQSKLLRLIETGEFEPVDSSLTRLCQSRLILCSNHSLQPLVERGDFRPDLYYRLNSMKFVIPPLRHRKVDLAPLARKLIRQFAFRHGVQIADVDPDVYAALQNYPWPGNVRELEQVVQRAVLHCRGSRLMKCHFPQHILSLETIPTENVSLESSTTSSLLSIDASDKTDQKLATQIAMNEKQIIEQTLFQNRFSRTNTAKQLGISRVTLYNKMKKYGLQN